MKRDATRSRIGAAKKACRGRNVKTVPHHVRSETNHNTPVAARMVASEIQDKIRSTR
jgi:hypothetical protein